MLDSDWKKIKYFKKEEFLGYGDKMEFFLVQLLDEFRRRLNKPIKILVGYAQKGHAEKSFHYSGKAVDIYIANTHQLDLYFLAEKTGFGGIGLYPFNNFIHLDNRSFIDGAARWIRDEEGIYHNLSAELIFNYFDKKGAIKK